LRAHTAAWHARSCSLSGPTQAAPAAARSARQDHPDERAICGTTRVPPPRAPGYGARPARWADHPARLAAELSPRSHVHATFRSFAIAKCRSTSQVDTLERAIVRPGVAPRA